MLHSNVFVFLNLNQYLFSNDFEGSHKLYANQFNVCQSKETLRCANDFAPEFNLLCFPIIIHPNVKRFLPIKSL